MLVKGGTVVNCDGRQQADVLIENGKIVEVAADIPVPPDTTVIDATDRCGLNLRIPGFNHEIGALAQ